MKWLKLIVLAALIIYGLIIAIFYGMQRKFIYFPPQLYLSPQAVGLPSFQEVVINSDDGDKLTAFWAPPKDNASKVVMFFHGNGSAVFSNHDIFRDLTNIGVGVLSVGYPGYPGSDGRPSQASTGRAARLHHDFLIKEGVTTDKLVYFGTSLGSGIAAQLAKQHPPSLLILDAPFNSLLDMGRKHTPFLPVKLLMKDQYRSDRVLTGLDIPLIWTHGTADNVVPISQGQKLFDSYRGPKQAHIIQDGQHTNLWGLGAREIIITALTK